MAETKLKPIFVHLINNKSTSNTRMNEKIKILSDMLKPLKEDYYVIILPTNGETSVNVFYEGKATTIDSETYQRIITKLLE